MHATLIEHAGSSYLEGPPGEPLLRTPSDITDLIGLCISHQADAILLYPENLPDRFFDLRSTQAGDLLQKLRKYSIRLALVLPDHAIPSGHFTEMLAEESRSPYFRTFPTHRAAQTWLITPLYP